MTGDGTSTATGTGSAGDPARGEVLLIEDDAHIAEALRYLLSRDGWQVRVHGDGSDAMAVIGLVRPAVVVLDVMLPGRSGLDVLADLRGDPVLSATPVLVLSASGHSVALAEAASARGPDGEGAWPGAGETTVMTKPFSNAEVVAAVRALSGGRRAA